MFPGHSPDAVATSPGQSESCAAVTGRDSTGHVQLGRNTQGMYDYYSHVIMPSFKVIPRCSKVYIYSKLALCIYVPYIIASLL